MANGVKNVLASVSSPSTFKTLYKNENDINKKVILHVEDEEFSRKVFQQYISLHLKCDARIIQCEDVIGAINVLMTEPRVDFAVLDYNFPTGFNGDSLQGILKSKGIPAVYYTATFKEFMKNVSFPVYEKGTDEVKLFKLLRLLLKNNVSDLRDLNDELNETKRFKDV